MKPILMSGPVVKATIEGRKTQTRRVIKFNREIPKGMNIHQQSGGTLAISWYEYNGGTHTTTIPQLISRCPYGKPGDILWVRETWNKFPAFEDVYYAADDYSATGIGEFDDPDHIEPHKIRWKPSIHMPRKSCRLFLRVKDIRVERVQDISTDDIAAEGVDNGKSNPAMGVRHDNMQRIAMLYLWDSINKKRGYGWDVNPWVWVVEYEAATANIQ